jgi:penicillin-binding protein 2
MLATPLQMANATCLLANQGYYYTPHLVASIDGENANDTLLKKYRVKHEMLTHIATDVYEVVTAGMQDVVERGTARAARIAGINICAKTGTAQNMILLDGIRCELKENATFVCFAPREDPKIAIAVVVENAGAGGPNAGPIASLLVEKYLRDTLSAERLRKVEEIAATNWMPPHLERVQYKADSIRGFAWFKMTGDSNYIRNYLKPGKPFVPPVLRKRR